MENRQSKFNSKSNSLEFWDGRNLLLKRMIFLEILVIYKPSTFTVCLKELMWNCEFGLVQWTNTKQTLLKFPSFNHTTKSSIGTFNYLTWKKGLFLSVLSCVCVNCEKVILGHIKASLSKSIWKLHLQTCSLSVQFGKWITGILMASVSPLSEEPLYSIQGI